MLSALAPAQQRLAIELTPGSRTRAKLSPALEFAAAFRSRWRIDLRFLGTAGRGMQVFELPRDESYKDIRDIRGFAAALPGVRRVVQWVDPRIDRIDELIVSYAPGRAADSRAFVGDQRQLTIVKEHAIGAFAVVRTDAIDGAVLLKLAARPEVERIEPNYLYRPSRRVADEPLYSRQWGLDWIRAPAAWTGVRRSPVIVAVLDTGVDSGHEDLATNLWRNLSEVVDGSDTDGNGYADDVLGYDFQADDPDISDGNGHGTHVAGIIGAIGDNDTGVSGVAWSVSVMALKIFSDDEVVAKAADIARAIDYALGNGARIINNSWGGYNPSSEVEEAIRRADASGALFVCAAGNDGHDNDTGGFYPASYDVANVFTVLAMNGDSPAFFTNHGRTTVHIAAPGVKVLSTTPGDTYSYTDGSSMAAPFVAGAAALVWAHPDHAALTHHEVMRLLATRSRPLTSLDGQCRHGGLDVGFLGATTGAVATEAGGPPDGPDGPDTPDDPEAPPTPPAAEELVGTLIYSADSPANAGRDWTLRARLRTESGEVELEIPNERGLARTLRWLNGKRVCAGCVRERSANDRKPAGKRAKVVGLRVIRGDR